MPWYAQGLQITNCQYLWKELSDPLGFYMYINYKLILSFELGVTSHAQTCPKNCEIKNPQYLLYLILDLVLNSEYTESVSLP